MTHTGTCRYCGKHVALRPDGLVHTHQLTGGADCPGGFREPTEPHRTELVGDKYGWHVDCVCGWRTWENRTSIAEARLDAGWPVGEGPDQ